MHVNPKNILGKEKYISHTVPCGTLLTNALCHTHVKYFLKGPEMWLLKRKFLDVA